MGEIKRIFFLLTVLDQGIEGAHWEVHCGALAANSTLHYLVVGVATVETQTLVVPSLVFAFINSDLAAAWAQRMRWEADSWWSVIFDQCSQMN